MSTTFDIKQALKDLSWKTPQINQGQIVQVSYAWNEDGELLCERYDQSDRSLAYWLADQDEANKIQDDSFDVFEPKIKTWFKIETEQGDAT